MAPKPPPTPYRPNLLDVQHQIETFIDRYQGLKDPQITNLVGGVVEYAIITAKQGDDVARALLKDLALLGAEQALATPIN